MERRQTEPLKIGSCSLTYWIYRLIFQLKCDFMANNVHNLGNKTFNLLFYFYICIII